jgi:hypothetical protein
MSHLFLPERGHEAGAESESILANFQLELRWGSQHEKFLQMRKVGSMSINVFAALCRLASPIAKRLNVDRHRSVDHHHVRSEPIV